jgi:precorrin-6Y C5,15-methyltransferase (decarboxylating)
LALSWDATTPAKVADQLVSRGCGGSVVTVCEALGGPRERIRRTRAADFDLADIDPLNIVAIEIEAGSEARLLPLTPGLPDNWFEHDGQITKRDVRAVTLAALAPRRGELLWDIGAGSGSIAIEWMLADPANSAIAVEAVAMRAARIRRNALGLGVPDLGIVEGSAPHALAGLARPDAVFIGGGATDDGVIAAAWGALGAGGRLIANAVTLETQSLFQAWRQRLGGDFVQIALAEAEPIGGFTGWRPARPIVQWRVEKRNE